MAGPFGISGTAALVGAMKAYEKMTGETVSQENADAATNELVVTSDLASDIGNEKAEELMALTKQRIADGDFDTVGEIQDVVKEASEELGVTLTDEQEYMGNSSSSAWMRRKPAGFFQKSHSFSKMWRIR